MATDTSYRGAIVWAVTAFMPEAPFTTVDPPAGNQHTFASADELARSLIDGTLSSEQLFLAPAKMRPLVLLQDRPRNALPEYVGLKLMRLEKLKAADRKRVRGGQEPSLFYLPSDRDRYGLNKEHAIDLNGLVRVHQSAIAGRPVGKLDTNELQLLGERLVSHLDVDLSPLIKAEVGNKLAELIERRAEGTH